MTSWIFPPPPTRTAASRDNERRLMEPCTIEPYWLNGTRLHEPTPLSLDGGSSRVGGGGNIQEVPWAVSDSLDGTMRPSAFGPLQKEAPLVGHTTPPKDPPETPMYEKRQGPHHTSSSHGSNHASGIKA
ncbi:hypothetical protein Scep_016461 [Stephania cephalantha]|uniref:Uncharacterized protein n=1 Tax=Stephania cephalantha TaxID=152367 RepID=A0AAP0INW8_9MAGN